MMTLVSLALTLMLAGSARQALAVAEVHKLNVVLSAMPSSIAGGDFKDDLDFLNKNYLESRGLEGMDPITYGWMFQGELRYQVRSNWAAHLGVGQMKMQTKREYLPALGASVQLREEILTVPITAGGSYYFQPYNQGDFQARAYLGGGIMSLVMNRVSASQFVMGTVPGVPSVESKWDAASPGWYAEGGVHMFFASRFSVLIGANYRSARIHHQLYTENTADPASVNTEVQSISSMRPYVLDVSGIGVRLGLGIGF